MKPLIFRNIVRDSEGFRTFIFFSILNAKATAAMQEPHKQELISKKNIGHSA